MPFYKVFGRNRPIETIDGYYETVHRGPFWLSRNRMILMKGQDEATSLCVMKCITSSPLDRDPTLRMYSCMLNLNRYNDSFKTRALDGDPVDHESTRSTRIKR